MIGIKKYFTSLNLVFFIEVLVVFLAVLGFLPREALLFLAGILLFFVLFSSYEESVLLIARSIPLFVALPITETFDSLNTWRVIVLVLFLKWFFDGNFFLFLDAVFKIIKKSKESFFGSLKFAYNKWRIESLMFLLLLVSFLSLFKAEDLTIGIKRIIYFANLAMLFFVVRSVAKKIGFLKIAKNVLVSGVLITVVGFIQLFMAYVMQINDFVEFWALDVNRVLYGNAWSNIVIGANTWFAYYADTIHLRMFSSFPDTHSFPLYLMMVLVFAMTLLFKKYLKGKKDIFLFIFIFTAMFAIILTGTRGIWASFVFPATVLFFWLFKKQVSKKTFKFLVVPFIIFLILLPISAPIFTSKQFKIDTSKEVSSKAFSERFMSMVDTEETSNKGRIYIWKESIKSIIKNPVLGVALGNFPVVLKENVSAIKSGASAHNIYLHIASELGLLGFLVFMLILYEIFKKAWFIFRENKNETVRYFALISFLFIIWISGYLMTDVAIFDERAFLMLMILLGVLFSFSTSQDKLTIIKNKNNV
jgi:O-antigen ligase